ncbi:EAL domain-containing protein [Burkholderiaceae bacterium DAT-1]|nr:EAL domain-containing protein [Burkholderiaceae bacterium DAT-1]
MFRGLGRRFRHRRRTRHIALAVGGYVMFACLWIVLSDQLLSNVLSKEALVKISTYKGLFFILVTAAGFYLALRSVPAHVPDGGAVVLSGHLAGETSGHRHIRWGTYLYAIVLPLAMLLLRSKGLATLHDHPLLILYMVPITICALIGGLGPGGVATLVSVSGAYVIASPESLSADSLSRLHFQLAMLFVVGWIVSITSESMRQALRRQKQSAQLLKAVISGTSDAIFIKDIHGRYLMANQAGADFVGVPPDTMVGLSDAAFFNAPSVELIRQRDHAVISGGEVRTAEEDVCTHRGEQRIFLSTKGPVRDPDGQVCGLFGISRDITAQKQAELALRTSEDALRQAQRLSLTGSWEWQLSTGKHIWSAQVYEIYGLPPDSGARAYSDLSHLYTDESWGILSQAIERAVSDGESFQCNAEIVQPGGEHRHVVSLCEVIRHPNGDMIGLRGTLQDVTAMRAAEARLRESEERLQRVIEVTSDGFWDWDVRSDQVYRSPRFYEVVGLQRTTENCGHLISDLILEEDRAAALHKMDMHISGESDALEIDFRLAYPVDETRWMRLCGRAIRRNSEGHAERIVGTITDVTVQRQHEILLREAGVVFESSYEGIMVVGPDMAIRRVNPSFTRITGYSADEVLGKNPHILSSGRQGPAFYEGMWRDIHANGFWRGEIWNRRKNGEVFAEMLSISSVRDANGQSQYYIAVFTDISKLKAHEAELDRVANYDALTGLPNRRLLSDRLTQAIARSERTNRACAICYLDVDGFKSVNDVYGHATGDQMLVTLANNLKAMLRAEDTLARVGGDEFVIILLELASNQECITILDRIVQAGALPMMCEGQPLQVSISIGVALYPDDHVDADTLLRHADQAMYAAKESGKNRYQLFDLENDRQAQSRRHQQDTLKMALDRGEFCLYYQPKVDLVDGTVYGAEALLRWHHPEKGVIHPAEFLPHIEGSDLDRTFGEWVIDQSVRQLAVWHEEGLQCNVSANVSAYHLLQSSFYDHLSAVLERNRDLTAHYFELEVLESAAIGDMEQAILILNRCRQLGVRFALDDFGTGYSSLTHLRRLPADTLKIDQSFVRDMLESRDDLGIVSGVIQLAHAFNLQVIAEGVETMDHGLELMHLGCRLVQGFGIARPMPAEDFPVWVRDWQQHQPWRYLPTRPYPAPQA